MSIDELDPEESATLAGLHYVDDSQPGHTRRCRGRGFTYLDHGGQPIRSTATVNRLRNLVVPPAWTDVWFCADPHGQIQATGRDSRNRKQYRYHDDWQRVRDDAKFDSLIGFGHALPELHPRSDEH